MHNYSPSDSPLRRFFAGLTESAFLTRIGLADPPLVDYVSDLLARFIHFDSIHAVHSAQGRPLQQVTDMVLEAQTRPAVEQGQVYCHIGDYTLFWAGMYPEALHRLQSGSRSDYFVDFCEQGKRSYHLASTLIGREAEQEPPVEPDLLERLSVNFEICASGLAEVRRELEGGEGPSAPTIIY